MTCISLHFYVLESLSTQTSRWGLDFDGGGGQVWSKNGDDHQIGGGIGQNFVRLGDPLQKKKTLVSESIYLPHP